MGDEERLADRSAEYKRAAALRAAEWIQDGMTLGLGTGSTVRYLLEHIAERCREGEWAGIVGIPTSEDTARRAASLGIPLSTLAKHPEIDLTIDGADEADPDLQLIKGLGGALLREKIVAVASGMVVIIVDQGKLVHQLGELAPLPVEADPFGAAIQPPLLRQLGADPVLRRREDDTVFVTDGGNHIFDCHFPAGITDPEALDQELNRRPGIIGHGLFLGLATAVVVGGKDGVRVLHRGEVPVVAQ